jgi:hypothetical protein
LIAGVFWIASAVALAATSKLSLEFPEDLANLTDRIKGASAWIPGTDAFAANAKAEPVTAT